MKYVGIWHLESTYFGYSLPRAGHHSVAESHLTIAVPAYQGTDNSCEYERAESQDKFAGDIRRRKTLRPDLCSIWEKPTPPNLQMALQKWRQKFRQCIPQLSPAEWQRCSRIIIVVRFQNLIFQRGNERVCNSLQKH